MTPCTVIHGDCLKIAPTLDYTAVISDPPYGMGWDTNTNRFSGGATTNGRGGKASRGRCGPLVEGDRVPFDPAPWLSAKRVVLFGSNHFAERLPVGTTLVWLKRNESAFGTFLSDAEVAWMKGGHGVYCRRDMSMNGKGANLANHHPTQKPVAIMQWCLERAGVTPDDVVLDPYCGSGSTLLACLAMGIPSIGIEIDADHAATAQRRVDEFQRSESFLAGIAS